MPNPDSIYLDTVRLQQLEREILVLNGPTKVAEIDRFPFTTHAEFVEAPSQEHSTIAAMQTAKQI